MPNMLSQLAALTKNAGIPQVGQPPQAPAPMQAPQPAPKPMGPSPFAAPVQKPNILTSALNGFQQGFDPQAYGARMQQEQGDAQTKQKQTLALMQQQRQLPPEQRAAWWQQNAPQISAIVGQDVSSKPIDPVQFSDQALDQQIAMLSAQMGQGPATQEPMSAYQQAQIEIEREKLNAPPKDNIRQVGNSILERQQDGSWKPVYTAATPQEAARAFSMFIDKKTGRQMFLMSDGRTRDTGIEAYIPTQITSVGGVPTAVDKRTLETSPLSPLEEAAGNKAAMASAEVQGKAQGQAAFDLPTVEMRSQAAIASIGDLRKRDISQRYGMQGKLYAIPGTDGADVQALVNQVTSQAFLNAFDQLRGAGAITEREGQAATQAITRLQNQNITIGEAMVAMDELERYYRKGLEVARQKATRGPTLPDRPAAPAQSGSIDVSDLLAKYK